jgi:hypothetical protein
MVSNSSSENSVPKASLKSSIRVSAWTRKRDQPGHATVFVDHDRHVVAALAELAQQDVETLGLGNDHRLTDQVLEHDITVPAHQLEQILGQQDALEFILVFAHHREPRMPGFDDHRQDLLQRVALVDYHHLRARNHRIAHLEFVDLQGTLDHGQGFAFDQAALGSLTQQVDQVFAAAGIGTEYPAEALQPGLAAGAVATGTVTAGTVTAATV